MYNAQELATLHKAGKAYKLRTGAIIPTNTPDDVGVAIEQAKRAHKTGGDDDDPGFRAHLTKRAAAFGTQRLIPASWASDDATTKAALTAKASRYETLAKTVSDPAAARGYSDLARQARAQADAIPAGARPAAKAAAGPRWQPLSKGAAPQPSAARAALAAGQWRVTNSLGESAVVNVPVLDHFKSAKVIQEASDNGQLRQLAKELAMLADFDEANGAAAHYDRMAARVSDPVERRAYEELAAKARQEARVA